MDDDLSESEVTPEIAAAPEPTAAGAETETSKPDLEAEHLARLEEAKVDLLNRLTRAQADLANLKRRTDQERDEIRLFANQLFAFEMLRVLDSLDRALASIPAQLQGFTWIDGLAIVRAQLWGVLSSQGIAPIEALGERFDPQYHDAASGESGADGAVVLEEYQRGYTMRDRVLRPAIVRAGVRQAESREAPNPQAARGEDIFPAGQSAENKDKQ